MEQTLAPIANLIIYVQLPNASSSTVSPQIYWLQECFLSISQVLFYIFVWWSCLFPGEEEDNLCPQICSLLFGGCLYSGCQAGSSLKLFILCSPLSFSRERPRDSEASSQGLSCDSSMLILIFITLYGIPLVVTERHVSFEIIGQIKKLQVYRRRESGFPSCGETDRHCTALGVFPMSKWQLPGPKEGSTCLGHERLHWWSLKTNIICVGGNSGCRPVLS